jgi:vacuolar-type H+-ATPase subunit I/STV1
MSKSTNQPSGKTLSTGDDQPKLKTADDLAIDALSQSSTKAVAGSQTTAASSLDETQQSEEFAQTLRSLGSVIESKANKLMILKQRAKEKREMISNVFSSDEQLQEVSEARQEVTQTFEQRKGVLNETTQVRQLREEVREIQEETKDIEESLSNHLINYHQLTNSTSFDTSDGDQWEFNITARVKTKKI